MTPLRRHVQTREGKQSQPRIQAGILSFMKIRIKDLQFLSESTLQSKGHKRPVLDMIFRYERREKIAVKYQITSTQQLQVKPRIKFEIFCSKKVSTSDLNGRSIENLKRVKRENERFSVLRQARVNYLAYVKGSSRKRSKGSLNVNVTKQTLKEKNLKKALPR